MNYTQASFRIDKTDFLKGNNVYDEFPEGGAIASTVGMNSFSKPGLLAQSPALGSSVTGSLPTGGVVSWGVGSGASSPATVSVYTNGSNNGSWYAVNPATGAMTGVGSADTTRSYKLGITDTVFYNGNFYTTSETDICKNSADLATRDQSWWITTSGKAALTSGIPHPLLMYDSIMYIADGRYLHKLDGTTISLQVWDAPPDHIITAMTEYNGLIYIVAEPYRNLTGSVHGLSQMFSWDGLLESWYEQYFLDYRINSLYVYKNRLYAWTNQFMGLWTGSELEPIYTVSNQVFKCHITAISDSMVFADGTKLVRYGKPFSPNLVRKFYNYLNASGALPFTGIVSLTGDSLIATEAHSTASPNYFISNLNTPATSGTKTISFNRRFFNQPVKPRGIVVTVESVLTSGQSVKVGYRDMFGQMQYPDSDSGTFAYATTKMRNQIAWEFNVSSKHATRSMLPVIEITGGVHIRSIDYLYEGSEAKIKKTIA
jgi:hypothetical protein